MISKMTIHDHRRKKRKRKKKTIPHLPSAAAAAAPPAFSSPPPTAEELGRIHSPLKRSQTCPEMMKPLLCPLTVGRDEEVQPGIRHRRRRRRRRGEKNSRTTTTLIMSRAAPSVVAGAAELMSLALLNLMLMELSRRGWAAFSFSAAAHRQGKGRACA